MMTASLNKAFATFQAVSADRDNFPAKIEPFVDKVRGQIEKYHEALTDSSQIAQIGLYWTWDMERNCTVLERGTLNNAWWNEYVKIMREGARSAGLQAEEVSGKFRRVRAALHQIVTDTEKVAKLSTPHLVLVFGGLELIVNHIDALAKWWDTMHALLEGIEGTGLARLDGNIGTMSVAMLQDTVSLVQESIKERKEEFKEYINQVHALQARNPPPRIY